jgi:hypothetical protein
VKRRVELPDEASTKILMSLAMAKQTDALERLITSGAVVRHARCFFDNADKQKMRPKRGLGMPPSLKLLNVFHERVCLCVYVCVCACAGTAGKGGWGGWLGAMAGVSGWEERLGE